MQLRWQDAVTETDPGSGNLNFNDASYVDTDLIVISDADKYGNDIADWIENLDGTGDPKGILTLTKIGSPDSWAVFNVTAVAIGGAGWHELTVAFVGQGVSFDDNDDVEVEYTKTGQQGATGDDGTNGTNGTNGTDGITPAVVYDWSDATTPDAGEVCLDDADPELATNMIFDDTDKYLNDRTNFIALFDDQINPTYRSILTLVQIDDPSIFLSWKVTGDVVDNTGSYSVPGELFERSGSGLSGPVALYFYPAGGKGDTGDQGDPGADGAAGADGAPFDPDTIKAYSTTSLLVELGLKVFESDAGRNWQYGQRLRAASIDGATVMEGAVSTYDSVTGNLTLTVDLIKGTGTWGDWYISIAGEKGQTGDQGEQGEQGEGITFDASGTLAERDAYDLEVRGFVYLQTDVAPNILFVKATDADGDWGEGTYIGGTPFAFGDWGSITEAVDSSYDLGTLV